MHEGHPPRVMRDLMRRQAALSLKIGAVFVVVLAGLPLLNFYLPQAMETRVFGFTLTWLLLGVLFYPITWLLSVLFVKQSHRIEHELAEAHRAEIEAQA